MSSRDQEQNELGAFLRARRSELSPSDVDLPQGGRQRRVAGLRREEVAQLAAISTDYYTRLEQGRIGPSGPVLASLARVLRAYCGRCPQSVARQVIRPQARWSIAR